MSTDQGEQIIEFSRIEILTDRLGVKQIGLRGGGKYQFYLTEEVIDYLSKRIKETYEFVEAKEKSE